MSVTTSKCIYEYIYLLVRKQECLYRTKLRIYCGLKRCTYLVSGLPEFSQTLFHAFELLKRFHTVQLKYEGWNFNSGNYLFTTDTK